MLCPRCPWIWLIPRGSLRNVAQSWVGSSPTKLVLCTLNSPPPPPTHAQCDWAFLAHGCRPSPSTPRVSFDVIHPSLGVCAPMPRPHSRIQKCMRVRDSQRPPAAASHTGWDLLGPRDCALDVAYPCGWGRSGVWVQLGARFGEALLRLHEPPVHPPQQVSTTLKATVPADQARGEDRFS